MNRLYQPAFVQSLFIKELRGRINESIEERQKEYKKAHASHRLNHLPLVKSFSHEWKDSPELKLSNTRPEYFPEKDNLLVLYVNSTAIDQRDQGDREPAEYSLGPDSRFYRSTIQVEFYSRRADFGEKSPDAKPPSIPDPERPSVPDPEPPYAEPLSVPEQLNIQCKLVLWAVYKAIAEIGADDALEKKGLHMLEMSGMEFDNIRGRQFPLTEFGMFRFAALMGPC